jgi:hypothetical protein
MVKISRSKSRNPRGNHKGTKHVNSQFNLNEFCEAIRIVEGRQKKKFFQHFIERAYENDKVLCVLINKFIPDVRPREDQSDENEMLKHKLGFIDVSPVDGKLKYSEYLQENPT